MRIAKIARAKDNAARKELLAECFNNYLRLAPAEVPEFERIWSEHAPEVGVMVSSFEISGRLKEKRDIVRKQLTKKFGPLSTAVVAQI